MQLLKETTYKKMKDNLIEIQFKMEPLDDAIINMILNSKTYAEPVKPYTQEPQYSRLIVLVGAGVGVGYGLPTFQTMKQTQNYTQLFSLSTFEDDPISFYEQVDSWVIACSVLPNITPPKASFIVTTNVDGLFVGNNVWQIHGSIHKSQCIHCKLIQEYTSTFKTACIPLCKMCLSPCRPWVQLYGDGDFIEEQEKKDAYALFKSDCDPLQTLVVEIGCGVDVPLLRHESHALYQRGFSVVRVNVKDFDATISGIVMDGRLAVERLLGSWSSYTDNQCHPLSLF